MVNACSGRFLMASCKSNSIGRFMGKGRSK